MFRKQRRPALILQAGQMRQKGGSSGSPSCGWRKGWRHAVSVCSGRKHALTQGQKRVPRLAGVAGSCRADAEAAAGIHILSRLSWESRALCTLPTPGSSSEPAAGLV